MTKTDKKIIKESKKELDVMASLRKRKDYPKLMKLAKKRLKKEIDIYNRGIKKTGKGFEEELEVYGNLCRKGKTKYAECQKDRVIETFREEFIKVLEGLKGKEIEKDRRPINVEIPEDMYVDGYNQKVQKQNEKIKEAIKNLK